MTARALVIMGVSGSGKSTVGAALAAHLNWPFFDGDDYHPPENVAKMAAGVPLTDRDRWPWLQRLHTLIRDHLDRDQSVIVACSALKRSYRNILRGDHAHFTFIFLDGDFDTIWPRMTARTGHYMKPGMLHSQFATLERPTPDEPVLTVAINQPENAIIASILAQLNHD